MNSDSDELELRRQFGLKIRRHCSALQLKRATSSPIGTLINNDVLKVNVGKDEVWNKRLSVHSFRQNINKISYKIINKFFKYP